MGTWDLTTSQVGQIERTEKKGLGSLISTHFIYLSLTKKDGVDNKWHSSTVPFFRVEAVRDSLREALLAAENTGQPGYIVSVMRR